MALSNPVLDVAANFQGDLLPVSLGDRTGVFVGEAVAVASAMSSAPAAVASTVFALQGIAIWSSLQLLAEVSRGRWGLCHSLSTDLPVGEDPPSTRLWESCWMER